MSSRSSVPSKVWRKAFASARRWSATSSPIPPTAFVLVSSPRRDAMQEATFFAERLAVAGQSVQALVVNRVHPSFGDEAPAGLRAAADALRGSSAESGETGRDAAARLAALYGNLADFRDIAALERAHIEDLRARIGARHRPRLRALSRPRRARLRHAARGRRAAVRYSLDPMTRSLGR